MHALRVNESKLTSRNAFIVNLLALESKKIKIWLKNRLLGLVADSRPVSLPLASELRQLTFFRTTLVLAVFCTLSVPLKTKRLNSLKSALIFASNRQLFCRLSVLVSCCAANLYSEIACPFSILLKNSARTKGELNISSFPSYLKLENVTLHCTQI